MATATVKPVEPVQRTVLLELTEDEALTLIFISHNIGGSPELSRRGHVDSMRLAICETLDWDRLEHVRASRDVLTGSIHFQDNE